VLISLGVDLGFGFHPLVVFIVIFIFGLSISIQDVNGLLLKKKQNSLSMYQS